MNWLSFAVASPPSASSRIDPTAANAPGTGLLQELDRRANQARIHRNVGNEGDWRGHPGENHVRRRAHRVELGACGAGYGREHGDCQQPDAPSTSVHTPPSLPLVILVALGYCSLPTPTLSVRPSTDSNSSGVVSFVTTPRRLVTSTSPNLLAAPPGRQYRTLARGVPSAPTSSMRTESRRCSVFPIRTRTTSCTEKSIVGACGSLNVARTPPSPTRCESDGAPDGHGLPPADREGDLTPTSRWSSAVRPPVLEPRATIPAPPPFHRGTTIRTGTRRRVPERLMAPCGARLHHVKNLLATYSLPTRFDDRRFRAPMTSDALDVVNDKTSEIVRWRSLHPGRLTLHSNLQKVRAEQKCRRFFPGNGSLP